MRDSNFNILHVRRVIFHDVPRNSRGGSSQPVLSEVETTLDPVRVEHLKASLVRTMQARSAYAVRFHENAVSPVPVLVSEYLSGKSNAAKFVEMTQKLASFLHQEQSGSSSPGLLTVLECSSDGNPCLILMKLEREAGAQLERTQNEAGKATFAMSVLNNLVLTDGTRLFKCAMFVRTPDGEFDALASDDQRSQGYGDMMAAFWRRFLGADYVQVPKIATKQFFEATMSFVNEKVTDVEDRNDIYQHLVSELSSQKKNFSPKQFIADYITDEYEDEFTAHMEQASVPLKQFPIDTAEIKSRIKRKAYRTAKGALISAPDDVIVIVSETDVTVKDSVSSLG